MRRPLGALIAVGFAGLAPAAGPTAPPEDLSLVEKLGAPAFRDREAAARELLRRGPAVLSTLEAAVSVHPDPETRQRAAALADQIRRSSDAAKLVTAKTVTLDYAAVPLAAALADLKAKTGVPLTLDTKGVADPLRPVTVKTGELPAWAAIDAFCRAAGLVEVFREELGRQAGDVPREAVRAARQQISYYGPTVPGADLPGQVPVILADGKPVTLPGDRSTAVRILALPASFSGNRVIRGSGQVVLNLDVTPLPGLRWLETASVRVHRAEDEAGRTVTVSQRADRASGGHPFEDLAFVGGGVIFLNNEIIYPGRATDSRPNPRVVPVVLRTDDRAIRTLRVFEGAVVGEVTLPNQPLVTFEDLSKMVGVTRAGPGDNKLTVLDYKAEPTQTVVKIRAESPNVFNLQRLGRWAPAVAFNNLNLWDAPQASPDAVKVEFFDADGKPVARPQQRGSMGSDDGIRQVREVELVFPKRMGGGVPVRLVATGNKPLAVEIPFRMENVPLP